MEAMEAPIVLVERSIAAAPRMLGPLPVEAVGETQYAVAASEQAGDELARAPTQLEELATKAQPATVATDAEEAATEHWVPIEVERPSLGSGRRGGHTGVTGGTGVEAVVGAEQPREEATAMGAEDTAKVRTVEAGLECLEPAPTSTPCRRRRTRRRRGPLKSPSTPRRGSVQRWTRTGRPPLSRKTPLGRTPCRRRRRKRLRSRHQRTQPMTLRCQRLRTGSAAFSSGPCSAEATRRLWPLLQRLARWSGQSGEGAKELSRRRVAGTRQKAAKLYEIWKTAGAEVKAKCQEGRDGAGGAPQGCGGRQGRRQGRRGRRGRRRRRPPRAPMLGLWPPKPRQKRRGSSARRETARPR